MEIAPMIRNIFKRLSITELSYVEVILMYDMEKTHTESPAILNILADIQEIKTAKIRTA